MQGRHRVIPLARVEFCKAIVHTSTAVPTLHRTSIIMAIPLTSKDKDLLPPAHVLMVGDDYVFN